MKPLQAFTREARSRLRDVLFDLDDTLTTDGRLKAQAYAALRGGAGFKVAADAILAAVGLREPS